MKKVFMDRLGAKNKYGKKQLWRKGHIVFIASVLAVTMFSACTPANKIFSPYTSAGNLVLPSSPQTREEKEQSKPPATRWDVYYSNLENAAAEVRVMQPLGTTRPMGKLIASSVAEQLERVGIKSSTQPLAINVNLPHKSDSSLNSTIDKNIYVLSGNAEIIKNDPRVRYAVIIRWVLSDPAGQVIATHSQGVDGSRKEWDLGDQRLLTSLSQGIAATIFEIVQGESKRAEPPVDPMTRGVLMAGIAGLSPQEGLL
ncbi:MAG: hypothetical protein OEW37_04800, partial [Rhodospirillaceae bacterium]|nr:hypothetical protein [Rhodospirillaceae bacterium]